jgi:3-methyl-2-oxobutanoate hydroxymethyltransferase
MRKTVLDIKSRKSPGSEPIVCLTAYTAPMAKLLDPHCDLLLVGDSLAMVIYGYDGTLQADMDMMIRHGQAVMRGSENAMVVIDMPFGTYQESKEAAFRNAARIMREAGASAVKIEGGSELAETVSYLTTRGIPVMGHVGLLPQSVNTLGGFKAQGRDEASAQKIIEDAKAICDAGAFTIVIEGVAEHLGAAITQAVSCPTIGIGASSACDGQILVCDDMLGLNAGKKAKFVKEYAHVAEAITAAAAQYSREVKSRFFPGPDHTYKSKSASSSEAPVASALELAPPEKTESAAPDALDFMPVVPDRTERVVKTEVEEKSATQPFILRAIRRSNND